MIAVDSNQILTTAVDVVLAIVGFLGVSVLKYIKTSIDDTKKSVDELNIKVATVIEKTANHEKQLDAHNDRIIHLEQKEK